MSESAYDIFNIVRLRRMNTKRAPLHWAFNNCEHQPGFIYDAGVRAEATGLGKNFS